MDFGRPQQRIEKSEGCKIKVNRDKEGRVSGIKTNGRCKKEEIDIFKENMKEQNQEL